MEEKENKIDSQFVPKNWERSDNIITIIGVGGGGSNAVNYMYAQNIPFVNFVVCNTDKKALEMSKVPTKIQLGQVLTRGLGAGTNPEVGKKAAKESIKEIEEALGAGTEMVFITCGMGGGTGTGAAPVVAEVAKNRGLLTVGVATIPFRDEGPEALYRAIEGIKEFNHH
ncbi:MAG: cell division protein FtsZ, partial [Bacteroidales bacterium]